MRVMLMAVLIAVAGVLLGGGVGVSAVSAGQPCVVLEASVTHTPVVESESLLDLVYFGTDRIRLVRAERGSGLFVLAQRWGLGSGDARVSDWRTHTYRLNEQLRSRSYPAWSVSAVYHPEIETSGIPGVLLVDSETGSFRWVVGYSSRHTHIFDGVADVVDHSCATGMELRRQTRDPAVPEGWRRADPR